jgi:hypothetical protein
MILGTGNRLCRSSALILLVCLCGSSLAADPLADSLRRCARESDGPQRLACFDSLVNALPNVQADQFGMTSDIARKRDPVAAEREATETLSAKIVALGQTPRGQWIFTLDDQQVWIQAEPLAALQFAVGEPVRIEHGAMGALWLAADKHRKTRVKRVQ